MGNTVLNIFLFKIFSKRIKFSKKKTTKNHFLRAMIIFEGKGQIMTKINITFFIRNYLLSIIPSRYYVFEKNFIFQETLESPLLMSITIF